MTDRRPITADKFFSWVWGFYVVVPFSFLTVITMIDSESKYLKERQYASDFYAILQGKQNEAIYDPDAEGFAHFLRTINKDQATSALLDIGFGYAVTFHQEYADSSGRLKSLNGAKALISRFNLDMNLFSDIQSYLEHQKFGKIVRNPQSRKELKALLMGEKTEPIIIDLTPYSPWKLIGFLLLVSQLAAGVTYFIGYAVSGTRSQRWWRLEWDLGWPYLAIPMWFPGALPLVAAAGLVSASIHIKRTAHTKKKSYSLLRENNLGLSSEFDASRFDASLTEGQELLRRLQERVRR